MIPNFNEYLTLEAIYEAVVTYHYDAREELRLVNFEIVDKGAAEESISAIRSRTKAILLDISNELKARPIGQDKKNTAYVFGNPIVVSKNGRKVIPTFKVQADSEDLADKEGRTFKRGSMEGTKFYAVASSDTLLTVMLAPKDWTDQDYIDQMRGHLIDVGKEANATWPSEVVHLNKMFYIDMTMSDEEFENSLIPKEEIKYSPIPKVEKEMVLSPGTELTFISNGEIKKAIISRTDREGADMIRVFFEGGSMKVFKKDDAFVVTPSRESERDLAMKQELGQTGQHFVGKIHTIGTYDRGKYKADYVRVSATRMI